MNESDTIEALSEISINATTYVSIFISVTFAYLTVAYIVGKQLSRFQCNAVSVLYFLIAGMAGAASLGWTMAWQTFREREASVFDELWIFNSVDWMLGMVPFIFFVMALSFYFMYDIRRNSAN